MSHIPPDVKEQYDDMRDSILDKLEQTKLKAGQDLTIDEFDIDRALIDTPKIQTRWLNDFTNETMALKELYGLREKVRLERWKYYQGKQPDSYYAKYGIVHEKILKTDIDKYLGADEKMSLVQDLVSAQKALVDYIENTLREIRNRGFHCKSIIEWRRFTSGG